MDQKTQKSFEEFTAVIQDLTAVVADIGKVEDAKARAAAEKHHQLLDGYIQREQAQILRLRGLEQHRIQLAETLGWNSLTCRQILERAPQEQVQILKPLFVQLEEQLQQMQQSRKSSEQIIQVRLHELQVAIARQEGSSYDNAGNVNLSAPLHNKMKNTYI